MITWSATSYRAVDLSHRNLWLFPSHLLGEAFAGDKQAFLVLPYFSTGYVNLGPFRLVDFPAGFALSSLVEGRVSVNAAPVPWAHWMDPFPSVEAASRVWATTTTYHSFNLGQIVFPQNPVSLLPILAFWCAVAYRAIVPRRVAPAG